MRTFSLFALCLASAVSLPATGQSTQAAAPAASLKPAPTQKASMQSAAQNAMTANGAPQTALQQDGTGQNAQTDAPDSQRNRWLALGQIAPAPKPGMKYNRPQMSFDKGIYAGRNTMTGDRACLAIQSYNFSEAAPGRMPKLESITTCTSVVQPLMRNARRPGGQHQQGQESQQDQDKDQK
jgi:hypothetical protein